MPISLKLLSDEIIFKNANKNKIFEENFCKNVKI